MYWNAFRIFFSIFRIPWLFSISVDCVLFFQFIRNSVLSNSAFAYFRYVIKTQKLSKIIEKHVLHIQATPDDGSERDRDKSGKCIQQFKLETKTLIRKLERILMKYWQNVSLLFDETCFNEPLLPNHTHTHTHIYIYIYIYKHINTHTHIYIYIFLYIWAHTGIYTRIYTFIYIYHHHHYQVVPPARISLTISRHFSLSFIASGRSSGLHPVSSHNCCM